MTTNCYFCNQPITGSPIKIEHHHPDKDRFVAETQAVYNYAPRFDTPSAIARQAYHERTQAQTRKMTAGPHLDDDGHTLVVPSEWYSRDAALFWKSHGFEWRPKTATWQRDTRKPLRGKRYTPQAWLTAARRRFYRFWPRLLKRCPRCGRNFPPTSPYQIHCPACRP